MNGTVRRDWLKRQVEAGKMEAKLDYEIEHDGSGAYDRFGGDWKDARIRNPKFEERETPYGTKVQTCVDADFVEGMMNFNESDFRTKTGHCWVGRAADGSTLYSFSIHSNASYTLRFKAREGVGVGGGRFTALYG